MAPKHRMTLSLSPATVHRLTRLARRRKGAKAALVELALERYVFADGEAPLDDAGLRRLDQHAKSLSVIGRDVAIATETLSLFVRYFLTLTPPLPVAERDAARALGRQRFEVFVAQIGQRLASDSRLVSEVLEEIALNKPDLFAAPLDASDPAGPVSAGASAGTSTGSRHG